MARLGGDQQHHLGASQGGQFIGLKEANGIHGLQINPRFNPAELPSPSFLAFFMIPVFLLLNVVYLRNLLPMYSILIFTLPFVFFPFGRRPPPPFWPFPLDFCAFPTVVPAAAPTVGGNITIPSAILF
jgi:hypothetical protein